MILVKRTMPAALIRGVRPFDGPMHHVGSWVTFLFNGQDVTDRCSGGSTDSGWMWLESGDEQGKVEFELSPEVRRLPRNQAQPIYDAWLILCATDAAETRPETHSVAQGALA